jgi:hypothetical protein
MSLGAVGTDFRLPLRGKLLQSGGTQGGLYKYVPLFDAFGNLVPSTNPAPVGFSGILIAKAIYDFATDGGADTTITPALNVTLPANAILLGGFVKAGAALVGATATIALGTTAGSSTTALLAATAIASFAADAMLPLVPTRAVPKELTAAGQITVTLAVAPLTAGQLEIFVEFVIPLFA